VRIVWITSARLDGAAVGTHSANATTRYRMLLPAGELVRLGHEVRTYGLYADAVEMSAALDRADVVVFNKLLADFGTARFDGAIRQYTQILGRIDQGRARVVMDVNDHHFDNPGFRDFYAGCRPHVWTTSTPAMANLMQECGIAPATVIPDPYEGPAGSAAPPLPTRFPRLFRALDRLSSQAGRRWRVSLLWFGHPSGLPALVA
jgi:hypothetical protein